MKIEKEKRMIKFVFFKKKITLNELEVKGGPRVVAPPF